MENLKEAIIDSSGKFKYIQINITDKTDPTQSKIIVRGYKSCSYHADILDKFVDEEVISSGLSSKVNYECPGGGRIEHTPHEKKIFIYGYS